MAHLSTQFVRLSDASASRGVLVGAAVKSLKAGKSKAFKGSAVLLSA